MTKRPTPHLADGEFVIRLGEPADIPSILRFFNDNRQPLADVEPRRPESFYTADFWQMRIQLNRSQFDDRRACCLFLFADDNATVIGDINFSGHVAYPFHAATLGYALDHRLWGAGRMYRALQLSLAYMFDDFNLHRVMANHLPENLRSEALLRRLGFCREGYARNYLLINGLWRDHVLNALTRDDWHSQDYTQPLLRTPTGL